MGTRPPRRDDGCLEGERNPWKERSRASESLDGGATPRSRVALGSVAERAVLTRNVQEVSRFQPRDSLVSLLARLEHMASLVGHVRPIMRPAVHVGMWRPSGSSILVRSRVPVQSSDFGRDGDNVRGALAVVTRTGCHRGKLRRVRACPGGSGGAALMLTSVAVRMGSPMPERTRTSGPAAGCNRPANDQLEQAAAVGRNHEGGT